MNPWRPAARRRRIIAVVFLALGATAPAFADSPTSAPASETSQQRVPLDLRVGGVDRGVVVAILHDNDFLIPIDALRDAGIKVAESKSITIGGTTYASLKALAPAITYAYDASALTLAIRIVDASALAASANTFDLAPPKMQTQAPTTIPSGFLTYDVIDSLARDSPSSLSGFFDAGFSSDEAHFEATNNVANTGFRRGLDTLTFDDETALRTIAIGDTYAATNDPLGTNVVIGGVMISRNFELQPDFLVYPTAGFKGTALAPTQADVYVNGGLYKTIELPPGPFNLENVSLPVGMNVTNVVLHDPFGNVTQFGGSFYGSQIVLAKGVTSYDYQLGFLRLDPFGPDEGYGPFAGVAAYRLGVTNTVTAGGAFETSAGTVDGGPSASFRTPLGQFDLAAAASDSRGSAGNAEYAAWAYAGGRLTAQIGTLLRSREFATIALPASSNRGTESAFESVTYRFSPRLYGELTHADSHYSQGSPADQTIASLNMRSGGKGTWILTAQRNRGSFFSSVATANQTTWALGAGYDVNVGTSGYLQAQTAAGKGAPSTSVTYSSSAPNSPGGLGYTTTAQSGQGQDSFTESAQYRAANFDAIEQVSDAPGGTSAFAGLTGSIAFFKQGAFFTSPLQDAYTLVHVAGPSGLPVSLAGAVQGTTNGRGYVVVPGMVPYVDNRVEVGGLGTLPEYQIDSSEKIVVPRNQSGAALDFTVRKVQIIVGRLLLRYDGKTVAPKYGVLQIVGATGKFSSDIGEHGEFYFENLQPGRYRGTITYADEAPCSFDLVISSSSEFTLDVGAHTCVEPSS
ncbi:MAG: fimbrial biogenesis outer membrane usher protein [Candidatus Eremiobacteraeota bacterium]|nr:fimbrial biogenesis outer membrane usher protein [Candidatus Eremiobacteraeota bacterium]